MHTKHTPGLWSNSNNGYIVRDKNNDPIANCHYTEAQSLILQEQQLANARLIAAAPEMLEALKWALSAEMALPKSMQHPELQQAIRAAIEKATAN